MIPPRRDRKSPFALIQDAAPQAPAYTFELEPNAFVDGRPDKPKAAVKVGLHLVAEDLFQRARSRAAQFAWRRHPELADEENRIECFNQQLVGELMAEAATLPNNVNEKYFGRLADTKIFLDLTTDGIRRIWDEYEAFAITHSPNAPQATDADIEVIAAGLESGELIASLSIEKSNRVRRLLKAILRECS